ncbi:putative quinol monooxygenase [Lentzea sp. NPDC059081]|uniref:putative quinol monooxygenase n=1 Tax=Lentzea sp. NPDC059081 TaxID=3346719 RepID=UPI0036B96320
MSDARPVLPEPDADETGPYTHLGFCQAKPGCEDEVEQLILGLVEPLRAEEGSIEFHVHRDRADRSQFVIYEMFRSKQDLEKHLAEPYVGEFVRAMQPLVQGPLRQQFLRMSSTLPAGE